MQPLLLRSGNFSASPSPEASGDEGPPRRRRRRPASAAGWPYTDESSEVISNSETASAVRSGRDHQMHAHSAAAFWLDAQEAQSVRGAGPAPEAGRQGCTAKVQSVLAAKAVRRGLLRRAWGRA